MEKILASNWSIWSNLFFIIPIVFAVSNKLWLHAFFIVLSLVLSLCYHLTGGRFFSIEDQMAAVALIAVNCVFLIKGFERHGVNNWLFVSIIFAIFALFLLKIENRFPDTHGFWHVFSGAVTLFCQLFFIG